MEARAAAPLLRTRAPRGERVQRGGRLAACLWILLGLWALLAAWSAVDSSLATSTPRLPGAVGLRAGLGLALLSGIAAWVLRARRAAFELVTSIPFGTALLVVLLAMTILGTVILQAPADQIALHYGPLLGGILIRLGLNDLFHTPWFTAFLALLAGSLAMVAVRRQAWRLPMWGHLGCHIGVVVVLVGGTVGRLSGRKAFLDLREGSSAASVLATEGGVETGERIPLGFAVRLDDFDVDRYRAETRVVAYRIDGDSMRPFLSLDAALGSGWSKAGEDGTELRVLGTKGAAAELELRSKGSVTRRTLGGSSKNATWLPDGRTVLALERRAAEAKAYRSRLSILEGGKTVCTKTIEVNDPLSWRGWHFYQSSFREEDPTWSGIQVVRDPGFPIVFAGFLMIGLGVIFVYYVRPWILRRRASA